MTTTWNPADKETNISLGDSNHLAQMNHTFDNGAVRGSTSHSAGKWYLEYPGFSSMGSAVATAMWIGFTTAAWTLTGTPSGQGANAIDLTGALHAAASGGGSTSPGSMASGPSGNDLSFAIDFTNQLFWIRYGSGSWFGTNGSAIVVGDPVAETNGIPFTLGGAYFPFVYIQEGNGGAIPVGHASINAGDRAFLYSVPSGYTPWDSTPPPSFSHGTVIH
jgi:hypothetical protein